MIFPIGKYKYLWSPKIKDLLTSQISKHMISRYNNLSIKNGLTDILQLYVVPDTFKIKQDFKKDINKEIIKTYKTNDLKSALE